MPGLFFLFRTCSLCSERTRSSFARAADRRERRPTPSSPMASSFLHGPVARAARPAPLSELHEKLASRSRTRPSIEISPIRRSPPVRARALYPRRTLLNTVGQDVRERFAHGVMPRGSRRHERISAKGCSKPRNLIV